MSFTRFRDDPARIEDELFQLTKTGRYQIDKPGPGENLPYIDEPQMRLDSWGANLSTEKTNLESDLRGLTRKLNRDLLEENNYMNYKSKSIPLSYRKVESFIEESRASHPAWMYKDLEQSRWEMPLINPQSNVEIPFHNNVNSRITTKDNFLPKKPEIK